MDRQAVPLLKEAAAGFRLDALDRIGLTARESEVLRAAGNAVARALRERLWAGRGVRSAKASSRPSTRRESDVPEFENPSQATPLAAIGPTITAMFKDGPLEGSSIEAEVVEGRPPKTIEVPANAGTTCRYCLADWVQSGRSAVYTFLYRV